MFIWIKHNKDVPGVRNLNKKIKSSVEFPKLDTLIGGAILNRIADDRLADGLANQSRPDSKIDDSFDGFDFDLENIGN